MKSRSIGLDEHYEHVTSVATNIAAHRPAMLDGAKEGRTHAAGCEGASAGE